MCNWRDLPAPSCLGFCRCLTSKHGCSGESDYFDSLVNYVMHQRMWHKRDPTEGFQGIVLKYLGMIFDSFSTKMQLNYLRLEISSCVNMCSNIKITTWEKLWIFWGWFCQAPLCPDEGSTFDLVIKPKISLVYTKCLSGRWSRNLEIFLQ